MLDLKSMFSSEIGKKSSPKQVKIALKRKLAATACKVWASTLTHRWQQGEYMACNTIPSLFPLLYPRT